MTLEQLEEFEEMIDDIDMALVSSGITNSSTDEEKLEFFLVVIAEKFKDKDFSYLFADPEDLT